MANNESLQGLTYGYLLVALKTPSYLLLLPCVSLSSAQREKECKSRPQKCFHRRIQNKTPLNTFYSKWSREVLTKCIFLCHFFRRYFLQFTVLTPLSLKRNKFNEVMKIMVTRTQFPLSSLIEHYMTTTIRQSKTTATKSSDKMMSI